MKQFHKKIIMLITSCILAFAISQTAFAHGLIYETKALGNNKIRITLKWSEPSEAKGIVIKSYYIENGKVLRITYDISTKAQKTAYIDYDLSSAIPPIRILLIKAGSESDVPFSDIKTCGTKDYIKHLHDAGIINGSSDGKFRPTDNMTRAEFVSILAKVLGLTGTVQNTWGFKDLDKNPAKNSILLAVKKGLIDGYSDKTFRPGSPITLAEVSKAICKGFKFKTTGNGFYMKLKTNKWYSEYVKRMFDLRILSVKDSIYGKINEEGPISRGNAAMIISRAMTTY